jgi:hypothetical protein
MIPDAFFKRGVRVMAGVRISNADVMLKILKQGGSAYHLLKGSSEKIALVSKSPRPYRRGIQKNQEYLHSPCHPELVSGSDLFFRF